MDEIRQFIAEQTGTRMKKVLEDSDIDFDLGCTGDDFHELIDAWSIRFKVKMDTYRWYFHTTDEGHSHSIGRWFFPAPSERVSHIAVTPKILLDAANAGTWNLVYPEHHLPRRRVDILINQILAVLTLAFVAYKCTR